MYMQGNCAFASWIRIFFLGGIHALPIWYPLDVAMLALSREM